MKNDLVVVGVFQLAPEANMARNRLEAEGIRAVISDEHASTMYWALTTAMGGIKVSVMSDQADRALKILGVEDRHADLEELERLAGESETEDGEEPAPADDEPESPTADDSPLNPREVLIERCLKAAIIGLVVMPLQIWVFGMVIRAFLAGDPLRPKSQFHLAVAASINVPMTLVTILVLRFMIFGTPVFPTLPAE